MGLGGCTHWLIREVGMDVENRQLGNLKQRYELVWPGRIEYLRIDARVLAPSEVKRLFKKGNPARGLVAWWPRMELAGGKRGHSSVEG
jgi:hypothetical protein